MPKTTDHARNLDPAKFNKGQLYTTAVKPKSAFDFSNISGCTIALDWLEIFGYARFDRTSKEEDVFVLSDSVAILYKGHGTAMYNELYEIYHDGEKFGMLQADPRFEKGAMTANSISLKVDNAWLYTIELWDVLQDVKTALKAEFHNVTRVDIAIDGLNHVRDFVNMYMKQTPEARFINKKGRSAMNAYEFDQETHLFQKFSFGSSKSDKVVSVYNKTKELENSNKKYIQRFWENSGMAWRVAEEEVYRVEVRLRSKALKKVKGFELEKLQDKDYLSSLFKTACKNFFEFTISSSDSNVTRQKEVKLIPYEKLNARLLEKTKRPMQTDRYKAKMTIHLLSKLLIEDTVTSKKEVESMVNTIDDMVKRYDLDEWYSKKADEWQQTYARISHPELHRRKT